MLASISASGWRSGTGVAAAAASQSAATTQRVLQFASPLSGAVRLTMRCKAGVDAAISASFLCWNFPSTSSILAPA